MTLEPPEKPERPEVERDCDACGKTFPVPPIADRCPRCLRGPLCASCYSIHLSECDKDRST